MLEGYLDFFMDPSVADIFCAIKEELDHLIQSKVRDTVGWLSRSLECLASYS